MKTLILGAGKRQRKEGAFHVDCIDFEGIDLQFDLNDPEWNPLLNIPFGEEKNFMPFAPEKWDHVSAIHLVEHLDSLVNFMDNVWRILKPGGSLYLETPLAGADWDLTHADPTHKRCYRVHTFANYFSLEGVEHFGYTDKPWNFFVLRVHNNCIQVHAYPIKK